MRENVTVVPRWNDGEDVDVQSKVDRGEGGTHLGRRIVGANTMLRLDAVI